MRLAPCCSRARSAGGQLRGRQEAPLLLTGPGRTWQPRTAASAHHGAPLTAWSVPSLRPVHQHESAHGDASIVPCCQPQPALLCSDDEVGCSLQCAPAAHAHVEQRQAAACVWVAPGWARGNRACSWGAPGDCFTGGR